jgi:hypothetical protein
VPHDDKKEQEKKDKKEGDREKTDSLAFFWSSMLDALKLQMTENTFHRWFARADCSWDAGSPVIELADRAAVATVSTRLHRVLTRTARRIAGRDDLTIAYRARKP